MVGLKQLFSRGGGRVDGGAVRGRTSGEHGSDRGAAFWAVGQLQAAAMLGAQFARNAQSRAEVNWLAFLGAFVRSLMTGYP